MGYKIGDDSQVPGVGSCTVDGVHYSDLTNKGVMHFHHSWYSTFVQVGDFDLAMWNLQTEYSLMKKIIKENYT